MEWVLSSWKTLSETFFKAPLLQPSKHRFRLQLISRQLLSNFKTPTVNSVLIISPCIILMSPCIVRNMIVWSNKRLQLFSVFICWISVNCAWHPYRAEKCIWWASLKGYLTLKLKIENICSLLRCDNLLTLSIQNTKDSILK